MKDSNPFGKNKRFYFSICCNVAEGLLSGCNFLLLYKIMKFLWEGEADFSRIMYMTAMLAAVFAVRLIIYSLGYTQGQIGGAAVSKKLRMSLGDKLKKIPLPRFTQGQVGQYVNTATSDVNSYEKILTHKAGDLAKNCSLSLTLIAFTGSIVPSAGVIMLCAFLLLIPALWISFRAVKKYGARKNAITAEAVSSMVEYATGIQTFRAYGVGGTKNKTVTAALKAFSDISFVYEVKIIPVGVMLSILVWLSLPLTMWTASIPWAQGRLDTISYLLLCMLPLFFAKLEGTIFIDLTSYKNLTISKGQIMRVLNEPEEIKKAGLFEPKTHEITFSQVDFAYIPNEPVLKKAEFTAKNRKFTAMVGDSGSGKSTILNLISKYYEPQAGQILMGGKKIGGIAAERVLENISMVDQDVFLFDDTIGNNIRYARPDATDEEVVEACRAANCDEFIRKLEKGYDTFVGENGNRLSGGERQRLSIARAILKDSPILLLDEATASLDIENELAVKEAIVNLLRRKKTVVMIAHTLSIVKNADKILVVSRGEIAEQGTHEELLKRNGKYAAMWQAENSL
ncbi:putative multidrug export ATP-binding/permease protein [Oxobacter pfennigii]|uniref:Putative multidrug export ATP-binding/permease protein n=1 Tax=Oxobacter pfennigii TaxID=36849 RepID=A0A0N8NSU4_9CLOT|nr:ABC transporter ATP-binding protein [Oxobacter pfennigii]KPU43000.1 putative multidrug export ATP-binding/permease protein [Oxobacter pfennigii]